MNLRILSVGALTGLLAATGCGGGSGPGAIAPSVTPPVGGSVGASAQKRSLTISFNIPTRAIKAATSSASRRPQYVSPGTAGVYLYLSSQFGTGTAIAPTAPVSAYPTGTAILSNFVPTSLSGSFTFSGAAIATLTGSSASTATVTAPYNITLSPNSGYSIVTFTLPSVVATGTLGVPNYVQVGAVFTDSSGYVLSEVEGTGTQVLTTGPTLVSLNLLPVPSTVYIYGSTGVQGVLGSPVTAAQAALTGTTGANSNIAAGSYELTAYVADHAGFIIPAQLAAGGGNYLPTSPTTGTPSTLVQFDNLASLNVTSSSVDVVPKYGLGTAAVASWLTNTSTTSISLDPLPTALQAAVATAASTAITSPGYLVSGLSIPGATSAYSNISSGIAINLTFAQQLTAQTGSPYVYLALTDAGLGTPSNSPVSGFTYTGSNYPSSGILGVPGSPTTQNKIAVPLTSVVQPIIQ